MFIFDFEISLNHFYAKLIFFGIKKDYIFEIGMKTENNGTSESFHDSNFAT